MKNYGKLLITVLVFILSAGILMAGGGRAREGQVIELGWYQPEPPGHPWTDVAFLIAEEIERRSGGSLRITVYHSGVLGSQADAVGMLRMGSLALLTTGPGVLSSFFDPVQIAGMPFIFNDVEHAKRFYATPFAQRMYNDIILSRSGLRTLDFWYFGDRHLTTQGLRATRPEHLSGVRIRGMESLVGRNQIEALGGNFVPIAFSELFFALQTGVVAGQENPLTTIIAQRFYEVQDHVILTGHSVHMGSVHVSELIWNTLSADHQRIIMEVLDEYRDEIERRIIRQTEEGKNYLRSRGVTLVELSDADMAAFRARADMVMDQNFGHIPEWREAIDAVRSVR